MNIKPDLGRETNEDGIHVRDWDRKLITIKIHMTAHLSRMRELEGNGSMAAASGASVGNASQHVQAPTPPRMAQSSASAHGWEKGLVKRGKIEIGPKSALAIPVLFLAHGRRRRCLT